MKNILAKEFVLRPHDPEGSWSTNDNRYRFYAHELLIELEGLCQKIIEIWPVEKGIAISMKAYPEISKLALTRDRISDSVIIFSAMAVEGYLNFYGVLRLGQNIYNAHFERLPFVQKVQTILLVCDHQEISKQHPLIKAAAQVSESRNKLVHPKAVEVTIGNNEVRSFELPIPEVAQASVQNMEDFFAEFLKLVPLAANHLGEAPRSYF